MNNNKKKEEMKERRSALLHILRRRYASMECVNGENPIVTQVENVSLEGRNTNDIIMKHIPIKSMSYQ